MAGAIGRGRSQRAVVGLESSPTATAFSCGSAYDGRMTPGHRRRRYRVSGIIVTVVTETDVRVTITAVYCYWSCGSSLRRHRRPFGMPVICSFRGSRMGFAAVRREEFVTEIRNYTYYI